jgi:hypothetical protein
MPIRQCETVQHVSRSDGDELRAPDAIADRRGHDLTARLEVPQRFPRACIERDQVTFGRSREHHVAAGCEHASRQGAARQRERPELASARYIERHHALRGFHGGRLPPAEVSAGEDLAALVCRGLIAGRGFRIDEAQEEHLPRSIVGRRLEIRAADARSDGMAFTRRQRCRIEDGAAIGLEALVPGLPHERHR